MKIRPWKRQTANLFDTWECVIILKESIIVRAVKKRTDLQNVKLL